MIGIIGATVVACDGRGPDVRSSDDASTTTTTTTISETTTLSTDSTSTSSTASSSTSTGASSSSSRRAVITADGGRIEVSGDSGSLEVLDLTTAEGWDVAVERPSDDRLIVVFTRQGRRTEVTVELTAGGISSSTRSTSGG